MDKNIIFEGVQEIFRDVFDDENLNITREMSAEDIEDWDSLEQINLLTAMGKKFDVKFKLEDVSGLENVGDMLDLIERLAK
ncbi:MAG: acyl carrier protein [Oscillospiraceae bacterium]